MERSDSMQPHLRPYSAGTDAEACLDVWRRASELGHRFLCHDQLDADAVLVRDIYLPKAEIVVAESEGRLTGFVALLDAFIGGLFVDPRLHGQGIGRALVGAAAARHGDLSVEVYAENTGALAFYRRLGFVETGRRPRDDQGRPHALVTMLRPATPAPLGTGRRDETVSAGHAPDACLNAETQD
jgi:ribosomal protein S18 acetylase RimI-like enzyme